MTITSDEVIFTIRVRANKDTNVSNILSVSSKVTAAESYTKAGDMKEIAINFTNGGDRLYFT